MSEEERYRAIDQKEADALSQSNKTYDDLLKQNAAFNKKQENYLNEYQLKQNDIYDKQTAWQVELQNQNKEKAEKDFQNEAIASKNAYYDFVNPYGVQREIQAQNGLNQSGYSESVKAQAWTTQQNRTAQARASLNDAKLQFDNAIKEAYLTNDTNKAQLALQILEQQQQEALRSFNYISDTQQNRLMNNQNLTNTYEDRRNTLYSQIQNEKAQEEAIRQFNEKMAFDREQAALAQSNWEREFAQSQAVANARYSGGGSSGSGSKGGSGGSSGNSGYDLGNSSNKNSSNVNAAAGISITPPNQTTQNEFNRLDSLFKNAGKNATARTSAKLQLQKAAYEGTITAQQAQELINRYGL